MYLNKVQNDHTEVFFLCHQVIPEQLPVNDRQIDDVVEELLVRQGEQQQEGDHSANLRPLLELHGGPIYDFLKCDPSGQLKPPVHLILPYCLGSRAVGSYH